MTKRIKLIRLYSLGLTFVILVLLLFVQVKGIPLPFMDDHRFQSVSPHRAQEHHHQQQAHQHQIPLPIPNQRIVPPPPPINNEDRTWVDGGRPKRQDDRPIMYQRNNGQRDRESWRYNQGWNQNIDHFSRDFGQSMYSNQNSHYSQFTPGHNIHYREKREAPFVAQMNDLQQHTQPEEQFDPYPNDFWDNSVDQDDYAYCESSDCVNRLKTNNLRGESNSPFMSGHGTRPTTNAPRDQTQDPRNVRSNTRKPLPLQMTRPHFQFQPGEHQELQNKQDHSREFYGDHAETLNYQNYLGSRVEKGYGLGFGPNVNMGIFPGGGVSMFPDRSIVRIRSSTFSIGDSLEIVRIELDVSEEDNEETKLEEVDDQY